MRSTYHEHPAFSEARSTSPTPSTQNDKEDVKADDNLVADVMAVDESRESPGKFSGTKDSVNRFEQVSSWTGITIFGQAVVLAVALTFFVLVQFFHVPLEQNLAEWAKASPSAFSFCVTVVSTVLSAISTFFFSKSLVLFLTAHSNRPTSLINFLTMTSLSRGAAVFSLQHFNWTLFSLFALVILNSLTASFTTILTPTPLIVNVPIGGRELAIDCDLFAEAEGNPRVARKFNPPTPADILLNNQVAAVVGPFILNAAYATASTHMGNPTIISYLGSSFNGTTGGVIPAAPLDDEALTAMPAFDSQSKFRNLRPRFRFYKAGFKPSKVFPFNYTTVQQGFTSDVKCEAISDKLSPEEPGISLRFEQNITLPDQSIRSVLRYFIQCPYRPVTNKTVLLRPGGSMIVASACPVIDETGLEVAGELLSIIGGYGPSYAFINGRGCYFRSYFTSVEVQYGAAINVHRVISQTPVTEKTVSVARLAYNVIPDSIVQYSIDDRNKIGDDLASLYSSADVGSQNDTLVNRIMEIYLKGLIETRGTSTRTPPLRAPRGHQIASSLNDLSDEWTRPFTGTWSYETLGWHPAQDSRRSTIACIIPILLITISSMGLSFYSWLSLKRSHHHINEPFDPNNLVTLLTAGRDGSVVESLGGRANAGKSASGKRLKIQLQRNDTQWELRPVFKES